MRMSMETRGQRGDNSRWRVPLRGALPPLRAVHLEHHGVVDVDPEGILYGTQIRSEARFGELNPAGEPVSQVLNEVEGGSSVALAR